MNEELKEAAEKWADDMYGSGEKEIQHGFIAGAQWQKEQVIEVMKYMCGYTDFPARQEGQGAYYWRTIMREKFKEIGIEITENVDKIA